MNAVINQCDVCSMQSVQFSESDEVCSKGEASMALEFAVEAYEKETGN